MEARTRQEENFIVKKHRKNLSWRLRFWDSCRRGTLFCYLAGRHKWNR